MWLKNERVKSEEVGEVRGPHVKVRHVACHYKILRSDTVKYLLVNISSRTTRQATGPFRLRRNPPVCFDQSVCKYLFSTSEGARSSREFFLK